MQSHHHTPDMRWFVLYTRPKYEKKIAEEISSMRYENYLPLRTTYRKWSDRMKKIQEPLFPNYVFVRISIAEKYRVLLADGVVRFVSFEGKPVPIHDYEIENIRMIGNAGCHIDHESVFCIGERVRVMQGAFAGLEGELLRKGKGSRLMIRLPVLNQAVSVEISAHQVQKIS